jgi:hypothetical protein
LLGGDDSIAVTYVEIFNCQIGSFTLKYLGVPISAKRLHVSDWFKLEEELVKKLDIWQGGHYLLVGGQC